MKPLDSLNLPLIAHTEPLLHPCERVDAAHNRQLILQVAKQLFSERGVEVVTMGEIAQGAGIGKGTLYRRFANKGELCLALMDEKLRHFQNEVLGILRQMAEQGRSYEDRIVAFLGRLVPFTLENLPYLVEVQAAQLTTSGERFDFPHVWQWLTLEGLLRQAQQVGDLSAELDLPYLAVALLSTLHVTALQIQLQQHHFSAERICTGLQIVVKQLFLGAKTQI